MTQQKNSGLYKAVHEALKQYHRPNVGESPFADLVLYQLTLNRPATTPRQATNFMLERAMERLRQSEPDEERLLHMRYIDRQPVQKVCNTLNLSESAVQTKQREAIEDVVLILKEQEENALHDQRHRLEQRLEPISNIHVVGVEDQVGQLMKAIQPHKSPWIVSIEGLGGIGKTTLADALVRRVIETNLYHEIGWISARQSRLTLSGSVVVSDTPAITAHHLIERLFAQLFPEAFQSIANNPKQMLSSLRHHLKEIPHLIVVDNLETVLDVESLLPALQDLSNPTKFVLTSRERNFGEPNVNHFVVPELGDSNSILLIRNEANISKLPELAAAQDDVLRPIYNTVGGNPLALRLVVGQTHVHTLSSILDDLKDARGESTENLYTYIYRKAWDALDEISRTVFISTVFLNDEMGDDVEFLAEVSNVALEQVRNALNVLVVRNLVDARGDFTQRLYRIHGLTRTFLHKQVVKWDDGIKEVKI